MHWTTPVLGLLLTLTGVARAQAPNEATFDVEYAAPAECPDEGTFVAAITARAPSARRVEAGGGEVHLHVHVVADGPSTLSVSFAQGSSRREIPAASCDEAVSSMAVIAAMVLEASPESRIAMSDAPVADDAASTAAPAVAAEPAPQPSPAPAPFVPPPDPVQDISPSRAVERGSSQERARLGFNAGVGLESAVAPSPPLIAAVGSTLAWERGGLWSPSLGLQFLVSAEATETSQDGDAEFRLVTGRLNGCPLRLGSDSSPRLRPCVSFDAGALRGEGAGAARNPQTEWIPWLSAGLALWGELDLGEAVRLEASASARVIPYHDKFIFRPDDLVYDIPPISLGFWTGLGFWP